MVCKEDLPVNNNNNNYKIITTITKAVSDLRVQQIPDLQQRGYAVSDNFKTVGRYGLQPILLGKLSYKIVFIFINFVRVLIKPNRDSWDPEDHLFIDYEGNAEMRIGDYITTYYRQKLKVCL